MKNEKSIRDFTIVYCKTKTRDWQIKICLRNVHVVADSANIDTRLRIRLNSGGRYASLAGIHQSFERDSVNFPKTFPVLAQPVQRSSRAGINTISGKLRLTVNYRRASTALHFICMRALLAQTHLAGRCETHSNFCRIYNLYLSALRL